MTCHVDATAAEPAPYRLVTSSAPFLRCFIGSSDTLDEASSLRGDMGAVYVFEREVSKVTVTILWTHNQNGSNFLHAYRVTNS